MFVIPKITGINYIRFCQISTTTYSKICTIKTRYQKTRKVSNHKALCKENCSVYVKIDGQS